MLKFVFSYLKSLKFRILLIILFFGIVPGFALRVGVIYAYENRAITLRASDIAGQAKLLAIQITSSSYLEDTSNSNISIQLEQMSTIYDGRIILIDSSFDIVEDTYSLDNGKTILSQDVIYAFQGETVQKYDSENRYIEMAIPINDESGQSVIGVMLISVSTDSINENLTYLRQNINTIQFLASIVSVVIGIFISARTVKPFNRLTSSIMDVQGGYEDDFSGVQTYTETARLSEACGEMLGRLQALDESRQEFVANVSHELKTPLTSMKVLADSLVMQEDVPVELYREFMTDIVEEIDRENNIINDLLSLVKLDKKSGDLNIESVNINDMLERIMKRLSPIARKQNIELIMESYRNVTAEVDEGKISLALTNLIENAIKYNNPEGYVKVTLNADHTNCIIVVEDNGLGIPEESLPHIFERFYRTDKSHSREIGGTGLGLAIARSAIIVHKGTIDVVSQVGKGSKFTVTIPLTYVAS